jgi:hypothetical protein
VTLHRIVIIIQACDVRQSSDAFRGFTIGLSEEENMPAGRYLLVQLAGDLHFLVLREVD